MALSWPEAKADGNLLIFFAIINFFRFSNFTIPQKKDTGDKFGNIVQAKQEMGMTKEQQEEAKKVLHNFWRKD